MNFSAEDVDRILSDVRGTLKDLQMLKRIPLTQEVKHLALPDWMPEHA